MRVTSAFLPCVWVLGLLAPGYAEAVAIEVEEWMAVSGSPGGVQVEVRDDFEDGVFDSAFYPVRCGGTPSESGGALVLDSPGSGSGCGAQPTQAVSGNVTLAHPGMMEATIRWASPAEGDAYGIQIAADSDNYVTLTVSTLGGILAVGALESAGGVLQLIGISVLSMDPSNFSASSVTLQIELIQAGSDLEAAFGFALDGGPIQSISTIRPGHLMGGVSYGPVIFTTGSVPEAGTGILIGSALVGLASRRRRAQRSATSSFSRPEPQRPR
jgi:hypothetical protein